VYVQGSKSSKAAIIDTATDTVIVQLDCANGCHGSYIGPKRGGGHYVVMSAAYQDKMSIYDAELLTKVGDVRTNMNSILSLQGTTASPFPVGVTSISYAVFCLKKKKSLLAGARTGILVMWMSSAVLFARSSSVFMWV